jgi:LysR family transcriptional regulator, flagellar master operon regulator
MDLDLVRTFIEIIESGSFVKAAERLNVTQSTVSSRVKELEQRLGREVFIRSKAGVTLTGSGLRFQPHARTMVRAWQQARSDVGLPERFSAVISIGAQYSLWDRMLLDWLVRAVREMADVAFRGDVETSEELIRRLYEGTLDIGVMYAPQFRAGLAMRHLLTDELVLVSTAEGGAGPGTPGYVFVDWGPEFRVSHDDAYASASGARNAPSIAFGLGALALRYLRRAGGSGYFPLRTVQALAEHGEFRIVADAPRFHRPAYAVYRTAEAGALLVQILDSLTAQAAAVIAPTAA